jgi:hypothetical protein
MGRLALGLVPAVVALVHVAVVVTWRRNRTHPAHALAAYPLLLAVVPLILALTLMRRPGRASHSP